MTKRLLAAMTAVVLILVAAPADAKTYHQGERGDRAGKAHRPSHGSGASRDCLRPAARALLDRIEAQFGPVRVISTCRPGARIAGTGRRSKHATGEAIDFLAPDGRKAEIVRWLVANHQSGGTMTYRGMGHIHVDIGYHFVALGSGGGRATRSASRSGRSSAQRVAARRGVDTVDLVKIAFKD
jgi:hypothetical protein